MVTIGIDPGKSGAIAVLRDGLFARVEATPVVTTTSGRAAYDEEMMVGALQVILKAYRSNHKFVVGIEHQQPYPQQGGVSNYSTGYGYGLWIGLIRAAGFPVRVLTVKNWRDVIFGEGELEKAVIFRKPDRKTKLTPKEKRENLAARKALMVTKALMMFPAAYKVINAGEDGKAEALLIAEATRRIYGV